jgi:single-strand DNA-binding protein
MSGVNQITIVGNVGSQPELNYGQNNNPFCRFSVAVNEQWKTDGEKREKVTWFPVIAFNGISGACANYLERGRLVAVQGRVQTREYDDKEGTKHQVMQVVAEKVTFLGGAKREEREEHDDRRPSPGKPASNSRQQGTSAEDDPPF